MKNRPKQYQPVSQQLWNEVPSTKKTIAKYVEDGVFWIVTAWAVTLIFPFHWATSIPAALLCGVAVWTALAASRARRYSRRRIWFRLTTVAAIVVATIWTLLGPILIARRPLYVITHKDWNPRESSFGPVRINKEVPAYLLVVADPVRSFAYSAIAQRVKRVRFTKMEDSKDSPYVRLPSLQQLTWSEYEPGLGIQESIQIPVVVGTNTLNLRFLSPKRVELRNATGWFLQSIVDINFVTTPGMAPWHGVLLGQTPEREAFEYVVLLDLAMRAIIDGNNNEAWNLLQRCVWANPPHVIEQARVLTLEARYADLVCKGNLGGQQALLYANPAKELLLDHIVSGTMTAPSPLARWIKESLIGIFEDYRTSMKADFKRLETLRLTPFEDKRNALFNRKLEEWQKLSSSELLHRVSTQQIKSLPEIVRVRTILTTRIMESIGKLFRFYNDKSEPPEGWDSLFSTLQEAEQSVHAITEIARREGAAGSADYLQASLVWFESLIKATKANDNDAIERLFASSPDPGTRRIMMALAAAKKGSEQIDLQSLSKSTGPLAIGPLVRWWEPEFQDWIRSAAIRLLLPDYGNGESHSDSLETTVSEIPLETLGRDAKGTGEPYLPGLFIACLVSQDLKEDRATQLVSQFEDLSGLDFKKFKTTLGKEGKTRDSED